MYFHGEYKGKISTFYLHDSHLIFTQSLDNTSCPDFLIDCYRDNPTKDQGKQHIENKRNNGIMECPELQCVSDNGKQEIISSGANGKRQNHCRCKIPEALPYN